MHTLRRLLAAAALVAVLASGTACAAPSNDGLLVRVPQDASTLSEAAEQVAPGGTILIAPGTYDDELQINTPDVTVRGEDRNATVIDGGGIRPYGIVSIADGVTVENLTVTGATFYGVLFTGLHDKNGPSAPTADGYTPWDPEAFPPLQRFLIDHVTAYNNGLYGIYAFNAQHGVIRDSYASGSADSGIYVGQCRNCDVLVAGNVAERNAVGFENANASDSVVITGNRFSRNRVGLTLLSSYQEAFTPQHANQVVGNLISDNDAADSPSQAEGGFATGVGISGGEANIFERNRISGNARAGVILTNTEDLPATGNRFTANVYAANGVDLGNVSAARTPATSNCAEDSPSTAPAALAAELTAGCDGSHAAQSATDAVAGPDAPIGSSFRDVAPPAPQPNLANPTERTTLPKTITMPDLEAVDVPADDFLADRAGSR
ncbi:right-handed parallel beta-helix repeat-containing protein [Microbacterium deminutum]|uniref:Periplasmic copper-binding protein NosD beta helix domain-containing protein n=1 Tax=Microbacterium deminutum TaxID=344164 RepID=A0ABN2QJC7_9MICO